MRRKDREVTNLTEILSIVGQAKILHLGLLDATYPYIVPMHYGYEYCDDKLIFFMHGAKEGHKTDLIRANPKVCVELECNTALISAGEIPCQYGSSFSSVIGHGEIAIVNDIDEKIHGLNLLMKNQTGREFTFNNQMADSVAVFKVTLSDFTAKQRAFPQ